jgi:hypothetical protein
LLLEPIDARGVELHLPRSRVIVAIGANRTRDAVVIQFAEAYREIAFMPESLWQADMRRNGLAEQLVLLWTPELLG